MSNGRQWGYSKHHFIHLPNLITQSATTSSPFLSISLFPRCSKHDSMCAYSEHSHNMPITWWQPTFCLASFPSPARSSLAVWNSCRGPGLRAWEWGYTLPAVGVDPFCTFVIRLVPTVLECSLYIVHVAMAIQPNCWDFLLLLHVVWVAYRWSHNCTQVFSFSHRYAIYLVLLRKLVAEPESLEIPMFFGELVRLRRADPSIT